MTVYAIYLSASLMYDHCRFVGFRFLKKASDASVVKRMARNIANCHGSGTGVLLMRSDRIPRSPWNQIEARSLHLGQDQWNRWPDLWWIWIVDRNGKSPDVWDPNPRTSHPDLEIRNLMSRTPYPRYDRDMYTRTPDPQFRFECDSDTRSPDLQPRFEIYTQISGSATCVQSL